MELAWAPSTLWVRTTRAQNEAEVRCASRGGCWEVLSERTWERESRLRGYALGNKSLCQERQRISQAMLEGCSGMEFKICRGWDSGCDSGLCWKWRIRAQGLGNSRRNGALGPKLRGLPRRSALNGSFLGGRPAGGDGWQVVRRWRLYATLNPFETLGVPATATDKEIKQAYRKLALKFHPDVNKAPDAQQKFMQIKTAYQAVGDEKSRAKYNASKRGSSSWDPFNWDSGRRSYQKSQEEDFYGFGEFFKDVTVSVEDFFRDLQGDRRRQASKPKSLWEELADIGEEFVEYLEKGLNINDTTANEQKKSDARDAARRKADAEDAKKNSKDSTQNSARDEQADKAQVEAEISEIEDMLAKLKKEMGM